MNYEVKIDSFEGPLDLLLHLVKELKVEIWDISIVDIANQYLDYIHQMEALNLDIASEYLVMASELLELKSRLLLPNHREEEVDEEEDPEQIFIQRLIEYQKYKEATKNFKELEEKRQEFFTKTPESLKEYVEEGTVLSSEVTLDDLVMAFQKFLKRQEENKPLHTKVTRREITVEERRNQIRSILNVKKRVSFFELFDVITKEYVVVTFLAVLEMARKNELWITQEHQFDEITCEVVA